MHRCKHEITRDILETLIEFDIGRGVARSKLLIGKRGGSLNYDVLNPLLDRLSDAGLIKMSQGLGTTKLCKILPKGRLWLSYFNQLEGMIGEGR